MRDRGGAPSIDLTASSRQLQQSASTTPRTIAARFLWRREIAPRQRAVLAIRLAERHREAGARELATEIERVAGFGDVELREQIVEPHRIARAREPLVVQNGDSVAIRKDPEV